MAKGAKIELYKLDLVEFWKWWYAEDLTQAYKVNLRLLAYERKNPRLIPLHSVTREGITFYKGYRKINNQNKNGKEKTC